MKRRARDLGYGEKRTVRAVRVEDDLWSRIVAEAARRSKLEVRGREIGPSEILRLLAKERLDELAAGDARGELRCYICNRKLAPDNVAGQVAHGDAQHPICATCKAGRERDQVEAPKLEPQFLDDVVAMIKMREEKPFGRVAAGGLLDDFDAGMPVAAAVVELARQGRVKREGGIVRRVPPPATVLDAGGLDKADSRKARKNQPELPLPLGPDTHTRRRSIEGRINSHIAAHRPDVKHGSRVVVKNMYWGHDSGGRFGPFQVQVKAGDILAKPIDGRESACRLAEIVREGYGVPFEKVAPNDDAALARGVKKVLVVLGPGSGLCYECGDDKKRHEGGKRRSGEEPKCGTAGSGCKCKKYVEGPS